MNAARSKILLVTRNLPPLVGGMERLNWHMAEELAKVADVRVVGPEGSAELAPVGVEMREASLRPLWKFLLRARALARREARMWKPDLVLAGSGLTAPLVRSAARCCGARTAVYVHGLDVAVRHPVYRAVWLPAIRRMDRVIANSRATAALCRGIGVDPARIGIVHPGVDLPPTTIPSRAARTFASLRPSQAKGEAKDFASFGTKGGDAQRRGDAGSRQTEHPLPQEGGRAQRGGMPSCEVNQDAKPAARSATGFRTRHNLTNRPLLLSVGRLSARKGLREFVTHALPQIVAAHPDVMLLVVGDAPKDALHARSQSPESIRAAATQAGVAGNLCFLGAITDYGELGVVYRAADVHVFPVREIPGDPEGFGMVAVEAAAHGLPTVAFATGGVVDAVSEGRSGFLVTPDDYMAFADAVLRVLPVRSSMPKSCLVFAQQFAWLKFGDQVVAQLAQVVPELAVHGESA